MNPVAAFLAWRNRRRAARIIAQAEHKRKAVQSQMAYRKPRKREYKYLMGVLQEATKASLRGSVSLRAYVEGR